MYRENNIKKVREEKHMTAKQIADYLGITMQAVNQYEKGLRSPSLITLVKISEFLEVPIDKLTGPQLTYMQKILREILKNFNFDIDRFADKINVPKLELRALYNNEETGITKLTVFKVLDYVGIKNPDRVAEIAMSDMETNILFNNKITPYVFDYFCNDEKEIIEQLMGDSNYLNILKETIIKNKINRIEKSEKKKNILQIDVTDLSKEDIENIEKYIEFIKFKNN